MMIHNIKIMLLSETTIGTSGREIRDKYTWFFGGGKYDKTNAGVAIVIDNKWTSAIDEVTPTSDRIMHITLKGPALTTFIAVYMPHAFLEWHEK